MLNRFWGGVPTPGLKIPELSGHRALSCMLIEAPSLIGAGVARDCNRVAQVPFSFDFDPVHRQKLTDMGMVRLVQIRRLAKENGLAFEQKDDAIGHLSHQIEIVRNHHGGQPQLMLQTQHQVA